MKRFLLIFAAAALIFLALAAFRFFWGGGEDIWLCNNGVWVNHGKPVMPMPDVPCE